MAVQPGGGAADFVIPDALPVLPLRDAVVFPLTAAPLVVAQPCSVRLVDDVMRSNRLLALVGQRDPKVEYTALSLTRPVATSDLERRFLAPFLDRHFGAGYPDLEYAEARRAGRLPANVRISEFCFQSGAVLGNEDAQREYVSLNYTHSRISPPGCPTGARCSIVATFFLELAATLSSARSAPSATG